MPATYFNRDGTGHSRRGASAREAGARAWSRLAPSLRRGLTSNQARDLGISTEWHHTGKFATEVHVYLPQAVEAFWASLDLSSVTPTEALDTPPILFGNETPERAIDIMRIQRALREAQDAAETIRAAWEADNND